MASPVASKVASKVMRFSVLSLALALVLPRAEVWAADTQRQVQKPASATAAKSTQSQQPVTAAQKLFSQAELDQMLAPVALYPDTVLTHVLIAATYPLEIVKATRWLSSQAGMTSEQALKAAENQPWDASVRALVAFPPLLTKMNNELDWTQKLGDAFLIQQSAVMATVQSLRQKAYSSGHLKDQEHITVQRREKEKVIIIEPRQREVVYIPVYDTRVVYGDWWWREYPPIHWPYGRPYTGSTFVYWGGGSRVSTSFYFSTFYWPQREVVVINHHRPSRYYHYDDIIRHEERRHWRHNPQHRHGVVYHTSYQPTREYYGPEQRVDDIGERRRWAATQRSEHQVSAPSDPLINQQFPVETSNGRTQEQQGQMTATDPSTGTVYDPDRQRLQDMTSQVPSVVDGQSLAPLPVPSHEPSHEPSQVEQAPVLTSNTELSSQQPVMESQPMPEQSVHEQQSDQQQQSEPVAQNPQPGSVWSPSDVTEPTAPVVAEAQPEPVYQQPEPVVQQPEPVYQQPEPVYQQPEPVAQQPEPVYQQPEPVYQQPEPVYQQPEPVYQQPEPVYQQPEPVYQQPEPVYQQPEPVYQQPEPVYQQPEPVYQQPAPVDQQPTPEFQRPIE
jgi:hypothetical protein